MVEGAEFHVTVAEGAGGVRARVGQGDGADVAGVVEVHHLQGFPRGRNSSTEASLGTSTGITVCESKKPS